MRKPGIALALMLSMFGIENFLQTRSAFFVHNQKMINLSIGLVVATAAALSFQKALALLQRPNKVYVLCLLLYAWAFLSYFWTPTPGIFRQRWLGSIPYLGIFLILGPVITQNKKSTTDGLRWTLYIGIPVVFATAFVCQWGSRGIILAAAAFDGKELSYEALPLAIAGFASYVGIISMLIHTKIPLANLFRFAVLGVCLYVAFKTRSRGQVIGIIAVSLFAFPVANKIGNVKGIAISSLGIAVLGGLVYYVASFMDLQRWRSQHVEEAVFGRRDAWIYLLEQWLSTGDLRILTGMGATSSFKVIGFYPHNVTVEILAELGLIGFGLFASILWLSAVNGFRLLLRLGDFPERRREILTLLGLLALALLLSMKEGSLYGWQILFFFAIALSQREEQTRREIARHRMIQFPVFPQPLRRV